MITSSSRTTLALQFGAAALLLAPAIILLQARDTLLGTPSNFAIRVACCMLPVFLFAGSCFAGAALALRAASMRPTLREEYRRNWGAAVRGAMMVLPACAALACSLAAVPSLHQINCSVVLSLLVFALAVLVPTDSAIRLDNRVLVMLFSVTTPLAFVVVHPLYMFLRDGRAKPAFTVMFLNAIAVVGYTLWLMHSAPR